MGGGKWEGGEGGCLQEGAASLRIAPMTRPRCHRLFPSRLLLAAIAAGSAALAAAAPAAGQAGLPGQTGLQPPIPNPPTNPPSNPASVAVAIGLLVLIIGANAIPSKRGHQD